MKSNDGEQSGIDWLFLVVLKGGMKGHLMEFFVNRLPPSTRKGGINSDAINFLERGGGVMQHKSLNSAATKKKKRKSS
jgi:hypothetical protein